MDSDERLHERLRGGELAAFDALYERHARRLYAFIDAHLRDAAEAEDVLHEAFLGLLRSGDVDFGRGSFKSWLYQIARNLCLNRLRSRGRGDRARQALATDGPVDARRDGADEQLAQREAGEALRTALGRLPAPLSEIYHLRASGLSYEEMSRVLALPLGTVKSRMHALIQQLKEEMLPWTVR
jgi:RNA polymerase sigma-70 factor (ECF subfamily)